jgi:hypothetical protein
MARPQVGKPAQPNENKDDLNLNVSHAEAVRRAIARPAPDAPEAGSSAKSTG